MPQLLVSGVFFMMSFQKLIPLILLKEFLNWIIWLFMILSLLIGVFGSLNQKDLKRLMAFSSIHHLGWILMCEMVESNLWLMYLFVYMLVVVSIILMLKYYEVNDLMCLHEWTKKWWILVSILSMGGMPPFLGFFFKWMTFIYIMFMNIFMVVFMIMMSVVMFYIYIRIAYDLMLGMKEKVSWNGSKMLKNYVYQVDYLMMMGGVVGGMFMYILIL